MGDIYNTVSNKKSLTGKNKGNYKTVLIPKQMISCLRNKIKHSYRKNKTTTKKKLLC